jgi:16S rRNA processing protein RimM
MAEQKVVVGRFGSPYGIKGWIKVISYTDPIENILSYLPWFIVKDRVSSALEKVVGKRHGKALIVKLDFCDSPEVARTFTNIDIAVDRNQLPALPEEEYYWIDLIGLNVLNQQDEDLGSVERLFETGSNDVLVVTDANGKKHYIPYTADVIVKVDLDEKIMRVDWDASF